MLHLGRHPRLPSALTELTDKLEKRFDHVKGTSANATLKFTKNLQESIQRAKEYIRVAKEEKKKVWGRA